MQRAVHTRRLYRFETACLDTHSREAPIRVLRLLGQKIWRQEKPPHRCPEIIAGRGVRYGKHLQSYCEGLRRIVLTRHQRKPTVLIHEITHALGYHTHGQRFVKRQFELLAKYAGFDQDELRLLATNFGIKI